MPEPTLLWARGRTDRPAKTEVPSHVCERCPIHLRRLPAFTTPTTPRQATTTPPSLSSPA
ncbi:hypothetical protein E2C01_074262 [Portunus trituberculatus]|uniref:Uncharacterized protein n=1 Tax=Portunus trituberculatus TaxID=210409 RepID=A0A5B7I587_PORTR|nr:hypothetical protein [Portunus trituberculatus]